MAIERELKTMQDEIASMKGTLKWIKDHVGEVGDLVKKMSFGLYGDPENEQPGLIQKEKNIEERMAVIESEIRRINEKDREQDVAIGAKKEQAKDWVKYAKMVARWIIEIIIIIAILKGVVDKDALLKI